METLENFVLFLCKRMKTPVTIIVKNKEELACMPITTPKETTAKSTLTKTTPPPMTQQAVPKPTQTRYVNAHLQPQMFQLFLAPQTLLPQALPVGSPIMKLNQNHSKWQLSSSNL